MNNNRLFSNFKQNKHNRMSMDFDFLIKNNKDRFHNVSINHNHFDNHFDSINNNDASI